MKVKLINNVKSQSLVLDLQHLAGRNIVELNSNISRKVGRKGRYSSTPWQPAPKSDLLSSEIYMKPQIQDTSHQPRDQSKLG